MLRKTVLFAVAIAMTLAWAITPSSAAGPLHQYFYNTTGIAHDTGHSHAGIDFTWAGQTYSNRTMWETTDAEVAFNLSSWYGPKPTVQGGATFHVCWNYLSPRYYDSSVVFDITYSSDPTIVLWSSGSKGIPAIGAADPWPMTVFCHNIVLNGAVYDKFQIRARAEVVVGGFDNSFKLYKSTYNTL